MDNVIYIFTRKGLIFSGYKQQFIVVLFFIKLATYICKLDFDGYIHGWIEREMKKI